MQPHNGVGNIGQDGIGGALFCAQERERRFHPRVSVLAELNQVTVVELGFTGGLLLDISAGGIAVQAAHPIEQGVTLGVKFLLPFNGYPVEATCAVAWSDGGHAGLKFAPLSEIAQRKLGLWVQAYGTRRPDRREIEASPIEVGQEVTTDPESRTPTTSAARRAESASPRQNVVPDLAECDPVGVGDDPQSMMGADAAVIALGDDRDVVRETSSAVESPRPDRRGSRRSLISVRMWARWKSESRT